MKTLIKSFTLVAVIFFSTVVSANNVEEYNKFGEFDVEEVAGVLTNSKEISKVYTIKYEEFKSPVTVEVFKNRGSKDFVVRSKGFEAQYTKGKTGFGVTKLDKKYAKVNVENFTFSVNRSNFLHQRVITQSNKSEAEYVKLIACYLPELVASK